MNHHELPQINPDNLPVDKEQAMEMRDVVFQQSIEAADSPQAVVAVIEKYYAAGGVVTTTAGQEYPEADLMGYFMNGDVDPAMITSRHGLREKYLQFYNSQPKNEAAIEDPNQPFDEWIFKNLYEPTATNIIERLDDLLSFLSAEEQRSGENYTAYKDRINQWRSEARDLKEAIANGGMIYSSNQLLQEIFFPNPS